eukprot:GHRR01030361.1.p1 GENE.GHRR01030361.1~~GHRR01030361.1.p1  ORF type:complete len:511 (+),score=137.46 GHRR01030361.1:274-1806(+)
MLQCLGTPTSIHSCTRASHKRRILQPRMNRYLIGWLTQPRALTPNKRRALELAALEEQNEAAPLTAVKQHQKDHAEIHKQQKEDFRPDEVDWLATGLCFIFPAIGGLLFGYDIGASSNVLVSLTDPQLSGTDWYQLFTFQNGLVVSMSLLGALLGSLIALASGNKLGRRTELIMAALLYGIGAGGMGASGSLNPLLACRVLYGLGIGFAMHAAPAYIAETSPPSVRGLLISLKEAIIVGGILAGYYAGYLFINEVGGWRSMYGVAAPLAVLLGVGMACLPESPRWLLLNGAGREEAVRALVRCEGKRAADLPLVEAEVEDMAASLRQADAFDTASKHKAAGGGGSSSSLASSLGLNLFQDSRYYRPLLVGLSLMLFQQITGQPSVLYYASQIFERAGFAGGQESAGISVLLGGFKLIMTLVAVATVDKLGRRPLLLGGVAGMVLALVLLTLAQGEVDSAAVQGAASAAAAGGVGVGAAWLSAVALLLYVGCYQVSTVTIVFMRGQAGSVD